MGMQKRQFFYASNYHLLVCKDGKLRRKENNLLKFYGLGCQKCNGSLICIVWLIDENINLEKERCDLSHVINVCTFLSLYLTLLS